MKTVMSLIETAVSLQSVNSGSVQHIPIPSSSQHSFKQEKVCVKLTNLMKLRGLYFQKIHFQNAFGFFFKKMLNLFYVCLYLFVTDLRNQFLWIACTDCSLFQLNTLCFVQLHCVPLVYITPPKTSSTYLRVT